MFAAGHNYTIANPATAAAKSNAVGHAESSTTLQNLLPRLDAVMMVLKTCKAQTCRNPWPVLHPQGNVQSLTAALNPQYNEFYQTQGKVEFQECLGGYFLENELPVHVKGYPADMA